MRERKRIGEILAELKVLSPLDVERVLAAARRRDRRPKFGQVARDMGLVSEEEILAALAVQMGLVPGAGRMTLEQILREIQAGPAAV
jgi:hypothetical protein